MYEPPSLDDIMFDLRNSVRAEVPGTDPWTWPNNLVPTLKAFAQLLRAGYLRLGVVHEQAFASLCSGEYLDFHGIDTGGLSREPSTYAQGYLIGATVAGSIVLDGTIFYRADGAQYMAVGTRTATGAQLAILVRAVSAGELYNTDSGALFTPEAAIAGFTTFTVNSAGVIGGSEEESDDSFRQRILFHKQNPPHGGSPSEYHEWARTKSGVTRVFVKRATPAPGSVTIYFMMDNIGDGIPSAGHVADLQNILNALAPASAEVIVAAPVPEIIDVELTGLTPDTTDMRDAVTEEIRSIFLKRAEPASVTTPFIFSRSWIDEAVSMTPRWVRSKTTDPTDDVTISTAGHIPVLGEVTFA